MDIVAGIAFEPVRYQPPPDIRGVLHVDRRSAKLRNLEYSCTSLPEAAGDRPVGGHVTFQHVPGGGWIIREYAAGASTFSAQRPALRSGRRFPQPDSSFRRPECFPGGQNCHLDQLK